MYKSNDNGYACVRQTQKLSVPIAQFCHELKTAVKNKVYLQKEI
jgi:hypothetical protein